MRLTSARVEVVDVGMMITLCFPGLGPSRRIQAEPLDYKTNNLTSWRVRDWMLQCLMLCVENNCCPYLSHRLVRRVLVCLAIPLKRVP